MLLSAMHWAQVESYLQTDDRIILPLGSTEQHAYLSLATDTILAGKIAEDVAAPLGVLVVPTLPYGITPYGSAYPGTISLRAASYIAVVRDILDELYTTGFRRVLVVNGHGGNSPARVALDEWICERHGARGRWHDWWSAPQTMVAVQQIDAIASHASWMESFPWTRLPDVPQPDAQKPLVDTVRLRQFGPSELRAALGDGSYGGRYQRADDEMLQIWQVAVAETTAALQSIGAD